MGKKKSSPSFAIERQEKILQTIQHKGSITVEEMVGKFEISKMTAWRDLKDLEAKGFVEKVYGGAIQKKKGALRELSVNERTSKNRPTKVKMAQYAVQNFIHPDQILFLDGGTTTLEIIPLITQTGITIVTNGLKSLNLSSLYSPKIRMIGTGGEIRSKSLTFVGDFAKNVFDIYTPDIFFTSGTGISILSGITDPDYFEAEVKKSMKRRAKKVIALMDSSKFTNDSGVTSLDFSDLDILITDSGAPEAFLEEIRKKGIEVVIV